jgi:hypothetical protein
LGARKYRATLVRDKTDDAAAVKIENVFVSGGASLEIKMRAGGGFVAKFEPAKQASA